MSFRLSVCIVTNTIDDKLFQTISSFKQEAFEICVGCNQLSVSEIAALEQKFPELRVVAMTWEGYGATKNKLAALASSDWILSIDSDEWADRTLVKTLMSLTLENPRRVYALQRMQRLGQHVIKHGSYGAPEWKPRLYNKWHVQWNLAKVHEELEYLDGSELLDVQSVEGILWHLTAENIAEVQEKNNHYAQLSAENMFQRGKSAHRLKPAMAAAMAFVKQYFLKNGLLDGGIGLQLARESARYTFLKYKFLRELQAR